MRPRRPSSVIRTARDAFQVTRGSPNPRAATRAVISVSRGSPLITKVPSAPDSARNSFAISGEKTAWFCCLGLCWDLSEPDRQDLGSRDWLTRLIAQAAPNVRHVVK